MNIMRSVLYTVQTNRHVTLWWERSPRSWETSRWAAWLGRPKTGRGTLTNK